MAPRKKRQSVATNSKAEPVLGSLMKAVADCKKAKEESNKLKKDVILKLEKDFNLTVDRAKRAMQKLEREQDAKKPSRTRSGREHRRTDKPDYTNGKWVIKGMDDAAETFTEEEQEYLKNAIKKLKSVDALKFEHLKYLVQYNFLEDLKGIKDGKVKSAIHDKYFALKGQSRVELGSEVRLSLFTNEQRDYLNGLLTELFECNTKDDNGDIKHHDIHYVGIVMLAEATIRIVKEIQKFDTIEETLEFMREKSYEAHGIS